MNNDWQAEQEYWRKRLLSLFQRHGLAFDPLQSDDSTVPDAKLVNQIQSPAKAKPEVYFATAYRHAFEFLTELERHGFNYRQFARVLEFGVGSGRLLRQFIPLGWKLHGCDVTSDLVAFSKQVLTGHADIRLTGSPPLPYEDGAFDFVYAVSVFTHIQIEETPAWVAELRRILRPGGALIVTVFEPNQYLPVSPREFDQIENGPGFYQWGSDDVRQRFMYMTPAKLREVWSSFDVLELRPGFKDQSRLIMRRRAA